LLFRNVVKRNYEVRTPNKVINNDIKKVTNTATENNSSPAMLLFIMEL